MPKRILIFSIAYHPFVGGAEVAIKEITDRVADFEYDMITLRLDSDLPAFERVGNINVYRIGFGKKKPTMSDLLAWPLMLNKFLFPVLAFAKAIELSRKNKYDIIWAMMAAYAGFAAMVYKFFYPKVKYLLTLQEGDPIGEIKSKVRFVYPLFERIFLSADYIQTISNYLADFARDMGYKGGIKVVPNAVDFELFSTEASANTLDLLKYQLGKEENDVYLITTSRLVKKNGIEDVIRSLPLLPGNVKFLILGLGPLESSLKDLAKELKLEDRIKWIGFVSYSDIPLYLQASDIFIRPSLSEGLGNSFLEAMAAGLPVIATPVGGIPDFLFDPELNPDKNPTGLFCKVNNPASIAKQVDSLLKDNVLRENIIRNGRELVREKYDWHIIAKEMKILFEGRML